MWVALAIGGLAFRAQSAQVIFPLTNSWRYNQTVSYDGVNWTAPNFDDSALPVGRGVLALEDAANPFVTSRTNTILTLGRITYYFRSSFVFTGDTFRTALTFSNLIDDGAVFYLNGREISRLFLPPAPATITYASLATSHEATAFDVFTLSGPIIETNLVNGTNILAVEVHQTTAGSTDIVLGCALSAGPAEITPAPLRLPWTPPVVGYTTVNAFPGLNFGQPLCFATPPGETNRLFVVSKAGTIRVVTNLANPNLTTFLDISGKVFTSGESGLLGLAFHPGYATNGYFFVAYSVNTLSVYGTNAIQQRLARFQTSTTNANFAPTNSELLLISQVDERDNHNGGDVHFGPDGYLYVSLGDGGRQYDASANSQRIDRDFFSAIMRLDVDSPPRPGSLMPNAHAANTNGGVISYRIPADNPFIGRTSFNGIALNPANVHTEFYAVGFRNPWRFSFDPTTDILYCADVGQDTYEEVSIITKGGNYGWGYREGLHPGYKAGTPVETLIDPIQEYAHTSQPGDANYKGNSVTGGVVYRGQRFPQLYGWYVFADYSSGNIWMLRYDGTNTVPFQRIAGQTGLAAFGTDPSNGDVLMANVNNGAVSRLVYDTNASTGQALPPTLSGTGAFTNLATLTNQTQALTASSGMAPYDVNVHLWSDGARKTRWFLAAPETKIGFSPEGNWAFSNGMAWVKHFDLELTNGVPSSVRRLETRFLVKNSNGVYGITYRWGDSLTNATLVPDEGMDETFTINDGGMLRTQVWHYPSRGECVVCHTPAGGFAIGFNTVQMNRDFGTNGSQIAAMSAAGYFTTNVSNIHSLRALSAPTNESASREWRVRSYLAANCAQCHQPGGTGLGAWNGNITNFTTAAGLIHGALVNNLGNSNARVIVPGSLSNSMLLTRMSIRGAGQMPPLATSLLDNDAIALFRAWITNDIAGGWTNTIAPLLLSVRATNSSAAVGFTQPANRAYRVEAATNLTSPITWQFLNVPENKPTYPASNNEAVVTDPGTNAAQKFYRVRVSTP
jgi:glucose/arabinose dehydrogenase